MRKSLLAYATVLLGFVGAAVSVNAAVITTIGAGTAVATPDRTATFTGISGSLLGYTENGLLVSVNAVHSSFPDAHYGRGGNFSFVTIATTDGLDFRGLEFNLGTGFRVGGPQHNVVWETLRDGVTTGAGVLTGILPLFGVPTGSPVLGWFDTDLFDTLRVGAAPTSEGYDRFGEFQAIVLDNVSIDFAAASAVSEPGSLAVIAAALGALALSRRRKKAQR
jgi:hypothetical protein